MNIRGTLEDVAIVWAATILLLGLGIPMFSYPAWFLEAFLNFAWCSGYILAAGLFVDLFYRTSKKVVRVASRAISLGVLFVNLYVLVLILLYGELIIAEPNTPFLVFEIIMLSFFMLILLYDIKLSIQEARR